MTKERIFSVGARDCRWDYYRGSGKGGQHRNKKSTAVRCVHIASGAVGCAEDQREQKQNKRLAFERMARTQTFQRWAKAEGLKRLGILADIETKINADLLANTWSKLSTTGVSGLPTPNSKLRNSILKT